MAAGYLTVELYCKDLNLVIATAVIADDNSGAVTGAIDLPAGTHEICIRLTPQSADLSYTEASLQVILGQEVATQSCTGTPLPN